MRRAADTNVSRRPARLVSAVALVSAVSCQGILGIEEPTLRDEGGDGGPGTGGFSDDGGGGSGGGSGGTGGFAEAGSGGSGGGGGGMDAGEDAGGSGGAGGGDPGDGGGDAAPPDGVVTINEVESNGGTPGDWVELYNPGTGAVDLSGYVFSDAGDNSYVIPNGSEIAPGGFFLLEEAAFGFGLGSNDSALLYLPDGTTLVSSFSWTAHALATYGACPDGSSTFSSNATSTKGAPNDCSPSVLINEVESSNGSPGDWVELYNAGLVAADVSGWIFRDNDDTHTFVIPSDTTIAPGRVLVLDEHNFGFGLGSDDAARLFLPDGTTVVDSYAWTQHAATTYGRCPVAGPFATTVNPTKGTPNACPGEDVIDLWPGTAEAVPVDGADALGDNVSGLDYEPGALPADDVIWAVRNAPSVLYRLKDNGTIWTPDTADGWGPGKPLRYPNDSGDPDAEGVTRTDWSANDIYVATERDNSDDQVSRPSVLRFAVAGSESSLVATHEWNLAADLPAAEANRGLEGIAWLPDALLVARGFYDERLGKTYDPLDYPDHGTGLFVVGLEANGTLYAYALDHAAGGAERVATIATGQLNVNEVTLDRDHGYLWAYCGAACTNVATVLDIDVDLASPTRGRFIVRAVYLAPATLTSVTNEGFTIAPESRCSGGQKAVFWADDDTSTSHALFEASLPCGALFP